MIRHLYIHIPFCKHICSYCDFPKRVSSIETMERYRDALIREIEINSSRIKNVNTIYIGGGTPSFFPFIGEVLDRISKYVNMDSLLEFTIESTAESVLNLLPYIKKYNVNRISIGIESRNEKTLEYIGRKYESKEELDSIIKRLRKEGIRNINVDMIHSLPFETIDSIRKGLLEIISLGVEHISYYDLIVEEKTILYHGLMNSRISLPSEDESILMIDEIEKTLSSNGFSQYEVSNFAKDGYRSIHNTSYWKMEEYIGLGSNSHSQYDGKRYSNPDLMEYLRINDSNFTTLREYYEFDEESEYFLLGLRMNDGVSIKEYIKRYDEDPIEKYNLGKHIDNGLLEIEGDMIRFTRSGMRIGNIVFEEFV